MGHWTLINHWNTEFQDSRGQPISETKVPGIIKVRQTLINHWNVQLSSKATEAAFKNDMKIAPQSKVPRQILSIFKVLGSFVI